MRLNSDYWAGLRGGLPIGLGYFAVSLAIGLSWSKADFPPLTSALFSATNMSSTGQFAGITIMAAKGGIVELAATTLLVNLRYLLMSVSLAGRLPRSVGTFRRMVMAAGITDEVYALNISRPCLSWIFYIGSMTLPILGWSMGTLSGALMGQVFPGQMQAAAGILLYAMFIAIVIPPAKTEWRVQIVVGVAMGASLLLNYAPYLRDLEVGWRIIIATVVAAGLGATFMPYVPENCQADAAGAQVMQEES